MRFKAGRTPPTGGGGIVEAEDAGGTVRYANPGAADMLRRLGIEAEGPRALFPADLAQRLAALKTSGARQGNPASLWMERTTSSCAW